MSILDDAIREHLELKRAHGADSAELKKLEDEAFGPPARPDQPDPLAEAPTEFLATEEAESGAEADAETGARRVANVADLQEAPEPPPAETPEQEREPSHSTGEREAIAEQPTEHFDVQAEIDSEAASPSDEELVDAEMEEPHVAPVAPAVDEEEDDFFSEQRLSDELSQALDAPIEDAPFEEEPEDEEHEESEEDELAEGEGEHEDEEEPAAESGERHEDVLEDTPDFLEDTPEDDDLWFEQRPPKDFDFDD
jgi:hypothetical protein